MTVSDISIIGGGPRGLSVALYALSRNLTVELFDPKPLSSWHTQNIISNILMRSPVSFDLVNFLPELSQFSLAKYLGYAVDYTSMSQKDVELCDIEVDRNKFYSYLEHIFKYLLSQKNFKYYSKRITNISQNFIRSNRNEYAYRNLVLSSGNYLNRIKYPSWIDYNNLSKKIVSLNSIKHISNCKILVVGSGQGAAEAVQYLASYNEVSWVVKKLPLVTKYPVPDYKYWGVKSALSNYYSNYLKTWNSKLNYLSKIKKWQPSITPKIKSELDRLDYELIQINSNVDLLKVNSDYDFVICITGYQLNYSLIRKLFDSNFLPIKHSYIPNTLDITNNFKVRNLDKVYVTGNLALSYDGPRQGSLISSGITSKTIVEDIIKRENG